jgi:hypothetical protein
MRSSFSLASTAVDAAPPLSAHTHLAPDDFLSLARLTIFTPAVKRRFSAWLLNNALVNSEKNKHRCRCEWSRPLHAGPSRPAIAIATSPACSGQISDEAALNIDASRTFPPAALVI